RLGAGRPLILGGVRVDHPRGLIGHSDADVVLHAITDAMLGAAGLSDIGDRYPGTDTAYRDRDSSFFVRDTPALLKQTGWRIVNVDVIIFAQEPKLGALKAKIRRSVADLMVLPENAVNIKAKTGEGVDAVGRSEAISCQAVVLIALQQQ